MRRELILAGLTMLALASCGDDDDTAGSPSPTPTSTASPAPTPTSTSTPTPSPAFDPQGARLGYLDIPGLLETYGICAMADISTADGKVVDIAPIEKLFDFSGNIDVSKDYLFDVSVNGWTQAVFAQDDFKSAGFFVDYVNQLGELQIAREPKLELVTYGLLNLDTSLCFYTALPYFDREPDGGQVSYDGFVDGLIQVPGDEDRLIGTARLYYGSTDSTYELQIDLHSVEDAFVDPAGQPRTALGTATATVKLNGATFEEATLTGPSGYSGTIRGRINYLGGAAFALQMTNAAGDRIYGIIAADGAQI